ncbi:hypothetical protein HOK00_05310, partial [bacterium]|nr:hypothetical protein [bacterium]
MIKIPSAFFIFYFFIIIFFLFPSLYILLTGEISELYRYYNYQKYMNGLYSLINSIVLSFIVFFGSYFIMKQKVLLFTNVTIEDDKLSGCSFLKQYVKIRRILLPITAI